MFWCCSISCHVNSAWKVCNPAEWNMFSHISSYLGISFFNVYPTWGTAGEVILIMDKLSHLFKHICFYLHDILKVFLRKPETILMMTMRKKKKNIYNFPWGDCHQPRTHVCAILQQQLCTGYVASKTGFMKSRDSICCHQVHIETLQGRGWGMRREPGNLRALAVAGPWTES